MMISKCSCLSIEANKNNILVILCEKLQHVNFVFWTRTDIFQVSIEVPLAGLNFSIDFFSKQNLIKFWLGVSFTARDFSCLYSLPSPSLSLSLSLCSNTNSLSFRPPLRHPLLRASNTLHTQARTHTHTLSFSFSFLSHLNLSILWAPDSVYGARWSRYVSNGYAYQSSLNVS